MGYRIGHRCSGSRFQSGNRKGVGTAAPALIQVAGMVQKGENLPFPGGQTEKHTHTHIVDAPLHGPVHHRQTVIIISLGTREMILFIKEGIVGFLETCVGSDTPGFQGAEVLHRHGSHLQVDTPHPGTFFVNCINRLQGIHHEIHAVMTGFSSQQKHTLMTLFQKGTGFFFQLELIQSDPVYILIAAAETAVKAFVGTSVSCVERSEEDHTSAVDFHLDIGRRLQNGFNRIGVFNREKLRRLGIAQTFEFPGLCQNLIQSPLHGCRRRNQLINNFVIDYRRISALHHPGCHRSPPCNR